MKPQFWLSGYASKFASGISSLSGFLVFSLFLLNCSGRNIHKDLKADSDILHRTWVVPTRASVESSPLDAGDNGIEFSNAAITDNTLLFGSQNVGIIALYPATQHVRWVLPIEGGVSSPLEVSNAAVFFLGRDGFVYSVNIESGKVNWRYQVRNTMSSRPVLSGGRLFLTTDDDTVYAIDAGSGEWLWHYKRRTGASASIHGASAPVIHNGEIITGFSDGYLVGLTLEEGTLKWEKKIHTGRKFTDVDAQAVIEQNVVYIPSYDGALYAVDLANRETLWRYDAGGARKVLIQEKQVILPSSDGKIVSLDKESGKVLWQFELDGGVPTEVIRADKYLVFGSTEQYLYAIHPENGKGLYRYNVGSGSGFRGAPIYHAPQKEVYILSGAGNLMAFALSSLSPNVHTSGVRPYHSSFGTPIRPRSPFHRR